jgi:hypothetical protein
MKIVDVLCGGRQFDLSDAPRGEAPSPLDVHDMHCAWHASLRGLEKVQSSRFSVFLRVATINRGEQDEV